MLGLTRLRAIPWLLVFEAARTLQVHFTEHLTAADGRRVVGIVRRTKGDPRRVTPAERRDLKAIAARLDLAQLGHDLVPTILRGNRGRKR